MVTADRSSSASCPARCALAGNPSDGHGGAVVATTIDALRATVTVTESDVFQVAGTDLDVRTVEEMGDRCRTFGPHEDQPLAAAAMVALCEHVGVELRPITIDVETTIPRSVGLAGSSAIVIATLRALVSHHRGASWSNRLATDPSLLASLALVAERDVLGIAAGLQDRVVQSFGGTVAMEFGTDHMRAIDGLPAGTYRSLPSPPGPLYVAYRPGTATDSGLVHGGASGRNRAFTGAMETVAGHARDAVRAIEADDRAALGRAMDGTFDARASVMELDPRHVEMVDVARRLGASANYTGSGGAVVLLTADRGPMHAVCDVLQHELGCVTLPVL